MTDTRTIIVEPPRAHSQNTALEKQQWLILPKRQVFRQTLYALFGNKDDLVAATITHHAQQNFALVEEGLRDCNSLREELDVYFARTTVKSFELIQGSEDIEDIMSGHSEAGRTAHTDVVKQHEKLVSRLLTPYKDRIEASGHTVQLAHFCVTCALRGLSTTQRTNVT